MYWCHLIDDGDGLSLCSAIIFSTTRLCVNEKHKKSIFGILFVEEDIDILGLERRCSPCDHYAYYIWLHTC